MDVKEMLQVVTQYAKQKSDCLRTGVGVAMCTGEKENLSLGYLSHNGPVGANKCSGEKGACGCFHAEIRAVMKVLKHDVTKHRSGVQNQDEFHKRRLQKEWDEMQWIIVCNYTPCTTCANFILQYAPWLKEWYYEYEYRNPRGMHMLRDAGIKCEKI